MPSIFTGFVTGFSRAVYPSKYKTYARKDWTHNHNGIRYFINIRIIILVYETPTFVGVLHDVRVQHIIF